MFSILAKATIFAHLQHWITHHGFWGGVASVFVLLFACGLGLPLPEDIPLIIAGAFLCTSTHSWIIVGIAAWCGIIGGDIMLYTMGRHFGSGITRVPVIGKHVTRERLESVKEMFDKYGVGVVGIGRMVAGIRGAMVICAGVIRFNIVKFLIADGLGAILSGGLFLFIGHWIGDKLSDPASEAMIRRFKEYFIGAAIIAGLIFFLYIRWKRRNKHKVVAAQDKIVETVAAAEKKVTDKIVQAAEKIVKKPEDPSSGPPPDAPPIPPPAQDPPNSNPH